MSKFEPNTTIRDIMKSLWDALIVKEHKTMLSILHKEIFSFMSTHLSSALWRERGGVPGSGQLPTSTSHIVDFAEALDRKAVGAGHEST